MKRIQIEITIEIETNSEFNEVEKAIKKGVYYGLDIKHICDPKHVYSIDLTNWNVKN